MSDLIGLFNDLDDRFDELQKAVESEFQTNLKIIDAKLNHCPSELRINIMVCLLGSALAEYIPDIRDNGLGLEAAGLKKTLLMIIKELDKTMVSGKDLKYVKILTGEKNPPSP